MPAKTRNVETLQEQTGNIYETIAIMAKRARQIAAREKMELDEKLKYFEGFDEEDDFAFNEEQERISKEFERREHAAQRALDEMEEGEIYYRMPESARH